MAMFNRYVSLPEGILFKLAEASFRSSSFSLNIGHIHVFFAGVIHWLYSIVGVYDKPSCGRP